MPDFDQLDNPGFKLPERSGRREPRVVPAPTLTEEMVFDSGTQISRMRVIETAARSFNAFPIPIVAAAPYPTTPIKLVGRDTRRQRVLVKNTHPEIPIHVGTLQGLTLGMGYMVSPGETLETQTQEDLYADHISEPDVTPNVPTTVTLSIWVETESGNA